jgi:cytochrome c oxidase subunit 1
LEWQTPSPPPTTNFDTPPVVTEGAYAYEKDPEEIYTVRKPAHV